MSKKLTFKHFFISHIFNDFQKWLHQKLIGVKHCEQLCLMLFVLKMYLSVLKMVFSVIILGANPKAGAVFTTLNFLLHLQIGPES
jgi:hypothetical protein